MILINDIKYSCLECIRGHRSSLCRHHMRPLLQVRSKGRPNLLFPQGNKDYRIAVFAQEVEEDTDVESKCKDTPVIILKTSGKHVINLNNGQIVGPYVASDEASLQKAVGPQDFVNTKSCCLTGSSKTRKNCECNKGKVLKKKILRSFLDRRLAASQKTDWEDTEPPVGMGSQHTKEPTLQFPLISALQAPAEAPCPSQKIPKGDCCSSKPAGPTTSSVLFTQESLNTADSSFPALLDPVLDVPTLNCGILKQEQSSPLDSNPLNACQEFCAIAVPSCSIPGTCCCQSDCSCPTCVVHQAPKKEQSYPLEMFNNDSQYGSNLILTLRSRAKGVDLASSDIDSYTSYLSRIIGCNVDEPAQGEPDPQGPVSSFPEQQTKCSCADNSCFCSNCETHSIINGYRLDDIFGTHGLPG